MGESLSEQHAFIKAGLAGSYEASDTLSASFREDVSACHTHSRPPPPRVNWFITVLSVPQRDSSPSTGEKWSLCHSGWCSFSALIVIQQFSMGSGKNAEIDLGAWPILIGQPTHAGTDLGIKCAETRLQIISLTRKETQIERRAFKFDFCLCLKFV